jgi:ERCC4-type nuclease
MILKIDIRETSLMQLCQQNISQIKQYEGIELVSEVLPIGDVIICDENNEYLIIERKSLVDLSSSITDGRYEEQSYRLDGLAHHNHNIIYLIEGEMNSFIMKSRKSKIDNSMLYSAMFSINYYKGFSLMRSSNIAETAIMLCNMCSKLKRDIAKGRVPYYRNLNPEISVKTVSKTETETELNSESDSQIEEKTDAEISKNYCTVIKKNKKENITKENIGEIMLCQIPGVSSTIAIAIMKNYNSFHGLMNDVNNNPKCLDNLCTTDKNGKQRKISKSAISSIIQFLTN